MWGVQLRAYVYLVPYIENEQHICLKTIIPSRKATRHHLGERLQAKAAQEGLPYQTLIASVLHKYVSGRLVNAQM